MSCSDLNFYSYAVVRPTAGYSCQAASPRRPGGKQVDRDAKEHLLADGATMGGRDSSPSNCFGRLVPGSPTTESVRVTVSTGDGGGKRVGDAASRRRCGGGAAGS